MEAPSLADRIAQAIAREAELDVVVTVRGRTIHLDGVVDSLSTSFKASEYSLTNLIVGYVASDRFALRQEDPVQ